MFAAFTRSTTTTVASCSYRCPARYLHHKPGQGLRQTNWRTAKAYPAPEPLMPKNLPSIPGFEHLSRRNVVTSDEDPFGVEEDEEEEGPALPRKPVTKLTKRDSGLDAEAEEWKRHAVVIRKAFPSGWHPPKKLSREAMDGLKLLNKQNPDVFTTPVLAEKFRISPEAVRRILKSKWEPSRERRQQMAQREKEVMQERSRAEYLEEAKSRIEAIAEKRQADKVESDRYWLESGRPEQERVSMEMQKNKRIRKAWVERQADDGQKRMPRVPVRGQEFAAIRSPSDKESKGSSREDLFFS